MRLSPLCIMRLRYSVPPGISGWLRACDRLVPSYIASSRNMQLTSGQTMAFLGCRTSPVGRDTNYSCSRRRITLSRNGRQVVFQVFQNVCSTGFLRAGDCTVYSSVGYRLSHFRTSEKKHNVPATQCIAPNTRNMAAPTHTNNGVWMGVWTSRRPPCCHR